MIKIVLPLSFNGKTTTFSQLQYGIIATTLIIMNHSVLDVLSMNSLLQV